MTEQNKAVEALLQTQQLLEQIVHHKSTCMDDVHKRIVANRAALSRPTQTADAVEAKAKKIADKAMAPPALRGPNNAYWKGRYDGALAALSHTATSEAAPTHDSGLAGELLGAAIEQSDKRIAHGEDTSLIAGYIADLCRRHRYTILTALQSNSDTELLREAATLRIIRTHSKSLNHAIEVQEAILALARLEQGEA